MKTLAWLQTNWKHLLLDICIGIFAGLVLLLSGIVIWVSTLQIPDLSAFEERQVRQSTKIYDRTGEILLYDLHQDVRRTIVPLEEISRHVRNATIAIEDDTFYNHNGINLRAIGRAALHNLQGGDLLGGQGGSTITQQVIKNALLEQDKLVTRKIKEAILALKLERMLEKDEILYHYLNESPYGGTIYGVEEAAQSFFGKPASDVNLAQAAYLAALPQAPTRLSPHGNNREWLDNRKDLVLERMLLNDFIDDEEYREAKNEEVEFLPPSVSGIRAPHFVMYVREQLIDMYGEDALAERGLKVITTLDYNLQAEAERIAAEGAESNSERFNATNVGMVASDPQTGEVLVMVGSRDYFSEEVEGNFNITLADRQPGSSIKPFVYANAFRRGFLPNTIVFDVKTQFSPRCSPNDLSSESPCYSPNNYNGRFIGPVSMRNALAQSLNIPAVKTLYLAGANDSLKLAADMGITTLSDPDRYGLTVVLGGGEVRLLDMTHAYGVFANDGVKADPHSILRIEDSRGEIIEDFSEPNTSQVLDQNVARMISDVLSDNVARTPLFGANSLVNFPDRDVAVKTGSTNNLRDAWVFGYTPNLVVGTWVGNNDNRPMGGGLSGLITTPMWREFMDFALEEREDGGSFSQPRIDTEGVKPIIRGDYVDASFVQQQIDESGTSTVSIDTVSDNVHNILHFVDRHDPRGPYPSNPRNDQQYENWEWAVQQWRRNTFPAAAPEVSEDLPVDIEVDEDEEVAEVDIDEDAEIEEFDPDEDEFEIEED